MLPGIQTATKMIMRRKEARAAREQTQAPPLSWNEAGLHHGLSPAYNVLNDGDARRIIDAAIELMRDAGVAFDHDETVIKLFTDAGCEIAEGGVVRFPSELVRNTLETAAKSVRLWNRDGSDFFEINNHSTRFLTGMTCIKVYDLETGEHRDSTREDLAMISRVADALPHIDGLSMGVKNVTQSDIHGEIDEFVVMAENTTKPLEYLCENAASLEAVIEMATVIRGTAEALREKPYFVHIITPLPLYYAKTHTDQIIACVKAGVPVGMGTICIGGASSPITLAGCLVHAVATDLAGMVLAQLIEPGTFCVGGSDAAFMEAATGGVGAFSQTAMADMAMCQISRELGIPSLTGVGGCCQARRFNNDAVWELSAGMVQTFYSRPATCDYMGSIDEGITYSLHALLYVHELAGLLRNMWKGIEVNDDTLAMDLSRQEGPRGNYFAQPHTAQHCRTEVWNARYLGAKLPVSSGALDDVELYDRIDKDLREILATHHPEPLNIDAASKITAIQQSFRQTWQES
jgi:trimethylamine---corrinoid protein Co-methyltransferase